jgi:hypothetical protein
MQLGYEIRAKSGLTLVANWTLSKQVYQNGYNVQRRILERSIYQYDQTHNVKRSAVYELPFGDGKRFWKPSSKALSRIVSGWETNILFSYHSEFRGGCRGISFTSRKPSFRTSTGTRRSCR